MRIILSRLSYYYPSTSSFLCAFSECRSPAFSDRSPSCTTIFKARRSRRNRPAFRFPDSGRERAWKPENDLPPFSPLSSGFFHTVENAWRESSRFHGKTRKFSASLRLCGRTARGCWDRKEQEKQAVFAQRRGEVFVEPCGETGIPIHFRRGQKIGPFPPCPSV